MEVLMIGMLIQVTITACQLIVINKNIIDVKYDLKSIRNKIGRM